MTNPKISVKSVSTLEANLASKCVDGLWFYLHASVNLVYYADTCYYITTETGYTYLASESLQEAIDEYNALG